MSSLREESSTFDKLPRLVFLGGSGAISVFTIKLLSEGVEGVAMIGAIGASLMWIVWFVLFTVETGRAEKVKRWF